MTNEDLKRLLLSVNAVTCSWLWAPFAAVCPWDRGTGWRSAQELTSRRCLGEHFPARRMSWDWSTWITEGKGPNRFTLIADDTLFKTSTSPESKRKKWPLSAPRVAQWGTFQQTSTIGFHLQSYQHPAAPHTEHYSPFYCIISIIFSCLSADLRLNSYIGFPPVKTIVI